jgi:uncharacterized protein (DUF3084 family)
MNRTATIALAALVVLLAGVSGTLYVKYREQGAHYAEVKSAEEAVRDRYDRTLAAIAEIQDSLDVITPEDATLKGSSSLAAEKDLGRPSSEQVLDQIAALRSSLERNKARIQKLERDLAKSGTKVASMTRVIDNLKRTVAEKESRIAVLEADVQKLQGEVSGLRTEVAQSQETLRVREETLAERQRELATVQVAVGSKKELTRAGLLVAKGGVLGIGKTLQPVATASSPAFTELDTDQTVVIPLPSTKARVMTAQPATSYEMRPVEGGMELRILDPKEFRKVRQLIILTA